VISVVIPVKNGGAALARCLDAVRTQHVEADVEIVVVDSGSTDESVSVARKHGARVETIPPSEFGHGRTRNLGVQLARGDVLVFTSQDAYAADAHWLSELVQPLRKGEQRAGVYGRQLPHADATPPERFFLDFLYGAEPRLQRLEREEELSFEATLFSNVNAAMPRAVWERFPFADDLIMSEDQEWSRRVLLAGYELVYAPKAAVYHSHAYTIGDAFRRFFDSGVSAERSYVGGTAGSSALRSAARRYAREELAWLWHSGHRRWIPYASAYELAKFLGLQLGRRHRLLPAAVKRRSSALVSYWDDA
jgi:glycosyltransferase involved in cell wall biosynthesis